MKIEVKIDSVLGGWSPIKYFAQKGQFVASIGIDPCMPIDDTALGMSGALRPVGMAKFSGTEITGVPLWMVPNPKDTNMYVYANDGKVHVVNSSFAMGTALNSGNALTTASGNGAAYYDNYAYFASNTDITRYGPLNGSPSLAQTYWTSGLSKTALANTTYPTIGAVALPNHPMLRHTDNKLYFADVVGNQGVLHYIATSKTTVEGDTNNGSTYNALDMPYGQYITAIESFGTDIAIATMEGTSTVVKGKAHLAFWDTTSSSYALITDVEFPDPFITALRNVNGTLYVFSGGAISGCRISRFAGGYTMQEVAYLEDTLPPLPGAVDHILNRVVFGGRTTYPETSASVYSVGMYTSQLGLPVHNILKATSAGTSPMVTTLKYFQNGSFARPQPIIGWSDGSAKGLDSLSTTYGVSVWRSEIFRIGKNFKVTKIDLQLGATLATNMTIVPKILVDDESTTYTLNTINSTNYTGRFVELFPTAMGSNDFMIELRWSGTALCPVKLPIRVFVETYERDN